MRVTMESTDVITDHGRVWRGVTESGIPCLVFVATLASETAEAHAALVAEQAADLKNVGRSGARVLATFDDLNPERQAEIRGKRG